MSDEPQTYVVGRIGGPANIVSTHTPLEAAESYARFHGGGTGPVFVIPRAHPDLLRFEQRTTVEAVDNAPSSAGSI